MRIVRSREFRSDILDHDLILKLLQLRKRLLQGIENIDSRFEGRSDCLLYSNNYQIKKN